MARTLTFEIIADDRFPKDYPEGIEENVKRRAKKVFETLRKIDGLLIGHGFLRELGFTDDKEGTTKQFRVEIGVAKSSRKTTWNDLYGIINEASEHAVHFSFIQEFNFLWAEETRGYIHKNKEHAGNSCERLEF